MIKIAGIWSMVLPILLEGLLGSCTHQPAAASGKVEPAKLRYMHKPPSHFLDTVRIKGPAAVFYYPDSFQLSSLREGLDTMVFKGIMHDYHYQMHYCHGFIQTEWPGVQITDIKNCRYVIFTVAGQRDQCIDLDARPDVYGLIVSSGSQPPLQVDMTNIRTQASFYLSHGKG